jgi:Bifunctional DNA primase/polymerase, N-terminal
LAKPALYATTLALLNASVATIPHRPAPAPQPKETIVGNRSVDFLGRRACAHCGGPTFALAADGQSVHGMCRVPPPWPWAHTARPKRDEHGHLFVSVEADVVAEPAPLSELGEGAVGLAGEGHPVFRLAPRDKVPPRGSHGFYDATADVEEVAAAWVASPDANIGYRPRPGEVVLDVDIHGDTGHGDVVLDLLVERHGPLPDTRTIATGGGGLHIVFTYDGRPLGAKFTEGIDVRTAHGGYLLGPPSIHPDTGRRYEWVRRAPVASIPDWLDALLPAPTTERRMDATEAPRAPRDGPLSPLAWFSSVVEVAEVLPEPPWVPMGRGRWRHSSATHPVSATLGGDGRLYVWSTSTELVASVPGGDVRGYSAFDLYAHYAFAGDETAATRYVVDRWRTKVGRAAR